MGDVVQPDGDGVVDEHPEHSVALWQSADQMTRFLVDALVDELGELVVVPPHSQRPVSGVHQFHCRVHDCPQRRVEVQSGGDDQHRLDQTIEAVPAPHDLIYPILNLEQEFRQVQVRQRAAHGCSVAVVVRSEVIRQSA